MTRCHFAARRPSGNGRQPAGSVPWRRRGRFGHERTALARTTRAALGPGDCLREQEDEAYVQHLSGMSTNRIELYLAEACNLRCRYCYVDGNAGAEQWPDAVGDRQAGYRAGFQPFWGGRSDSHYLLRRRAVLNKPVLRQAIEYSQQLGVARGKRVSYSMTTNATLLDDDIIGLIKRYNFGLMVSLDGPTRGP